MSPWLILAGLLISAAAALLFSTVSYALRDLSRARLAEALERRGRAALLDSTLTSAGDLTARRAVQRTALQPSPSQAKVPSPPKETAPLPRKPTETIASPPLGNPFELLASVWRSSSDMLARRTFTSSGGTP